MRIQTQELLEYLTADGRCPFADWLKALQDRKARAIIRVRLNRLRLENFGDCKSTGKGVSELKIDFGPGYQIHFGREGDSLVILLCGGDKKGQKRDIARAQTF